MMCEEQEPQPIGSDITKERRNRKPPQALSFEPTENPNWRRKDVPSTSTMLSEIKQMKNKFENSPKELQETFKQRYTRREAFHFVLASNKLELVGTQTEGNTEELCNKALEKLVDPSSKDKVQKDVETTQTCLALLKSFQQVEELSKLASSDCEKLIITPETIQEIHRVLMFNLIDNPGQFRKFGAYPLGYDYNYCEPEQIENKLLYFLDSFYEILDFQPEISLEVAFKLAALVMFNVLDIHPFSDGNGRLCRILANRMLCLHHFFCVYMQPAADSSSPDVWRKIYMDSLVDCRDKSNPKRYPRDLTALLIESSWLAWRRITTEMESQIVEGKICIGSIYITSKVLRTSEDDLKKYVTTRYNTLTKLRAQKQKENDEIQLLINAIRNRQNICVFNDQRVVVLDISSNTK